MRAFNGAKWIWTDKSAGKDEYGEFFASIMGKKPTLFRISCDGDYTLSINNRYVASNQYGDYEHYKVYDEIDVTEYLEDGKNEIVVLVWHFGENSQRYVNAQAGVIFEAERGGKIVLVSSEEILCHISNAYKSGYCKRITCQLGYSFLYDAEKEVGGECKRAVPVEKDRVFYRRPTEKLKLLSEAESTILKDDGKYFLIDLCQETFGLPVLRFSSNCEQKILVAWGEDLQNGHVRRLIGDRDFSFEYVAKKGQNEYVNYMLRLGCRYLELYAEEPIVLQYLGLIPQVYPVREKSFVAQNETDRRIYDVCVKTLKLSMAEHYMDTPWREQCLYAFDSRNQMLCGYYAFENGNAAYARANLLLMSKDRREDGLLSVCSPCGTDLAIPSFSLYYFMAVKEYIEHTDDCTLGEEVYEKLLSIVDVFLKNEKDGLICAFDGVNRWNFYDWSEYSEGKLRKADIARPDLVINCLFILALENLRYISEKVGNKYPYKEKSEEIRKNTRKAFYDGNTEAFTMTECGEEFTELGNALAVLSKVAENPTALCERIARGDFVGCSLSMKCFVYDALLMTDKDRWGKYVLEKIRTDYKIMLDYGATSVWETMGGAEAFGNAGSLCHGWSAIPVYYLRKLGEKQSREKVSKENL